jgi:hypothetical protein
MEPESLMKTKFINNPSVDPITGETIKIGSKKYKNLIEKYGEPNKIKSPKTNKLIGVNKTEYKKFIKEGYTDKQLLMNEIKIFKVGGKNYTENELLMMINYYNNHVKTVPDLNLKEIMYYTDEEPIIARPIMKSIDILNDDIMRQVLYNSDINEIVNFCITNKYQSVCDDKTLWKYIFKRDHVKIIEEPDNYQGWINMYYKVLDAQKEAFVLITLSNEITGGGYDFKIENNFDIYFGIYFELLLKTNTFYTNKLKKEVNIKTTYGDKIISMKTFYNLLVDLLYFYPDIKIISIDLNKEIPLRKKFIGDLRYKTGYKTITNQILYRYQIVYAQQYKNIIKQINNL